MDFLEDLVELVKVAGLSGAIALLSMISIITIILMFSKRIKELTDAITILTEKVSSPYLDTKLSLILFRSIMNNHITKKLAYLGDILARNSLDDRENQIKKNIENEFRRITTGEAEKLSSYKSVCGDMGKILEDFIDWKIFLAPIYDILYTTDTDHQKIMDIRALMNREVDKIAKIIENNGMRN